MVQASAPNVVAKKEHGCGWSQSKCQALLGQAFKCEVWGVSGERESVLALLPVPKHTAAPDDFNKEMQAEPAEQSSALRKFLKRDVPMPLAMLQGPHMFRVGLITR